MRFALKDNKQWLWYLIFAVGLTALLLYINFPSKALTDYIRVQAENGYPDINIDFDKIGLTLYPGIQIRGLKITLKEYPDTPVYVSEKTSIRVSILSWIKGDPAYYFESSVNGGEISGVIQEKNEVKKERVDAAIELKEIKLDKRIFIHPIVSERIEGSVAGKIIFMGSLSDPLKGNTEISLNLSDGMIKFKNPIFDLNALEFKKINISGVIDNRRLNIKEFNMTGKDVNGSATGTIQIGNEIQNSRLNLKTEIEPLPSLYQDIPKVGKAINGIKSKMSDGKLRIDLRGTLDRPLPILR
jgi:type II secretion system protein N